MAGHDNTKTSKGTGYLIKIAALLPAAGFFILFSMQSAFGYYLIKTPNKPIKTECYHIIGDVIYLCEGMKLPLSDVVSIDENNLTESEIEKKKSDSKKFYNEVELLINAGNILDANLSDLNKLMAIIIDKKASKDKSLKNDIKKAQKDITKINSESKKLKKQWLDIRIPSKQFTVLREVKQLELNSIEAVCVDYTEYIDDWSPTVREYAKESLRQKTVFEASFNRYLKDLKQSQP